MSESSLQTSSSEASHVEFAGHSSEPVTRWRNSDHTRTDRDPTGMMHYGRHFCRFIHPFRDIRKLLAAGLALARYDRAGELLCTPEQEKNMELLLALLNLDPNLKSSILGIASQFQQRGLWFPAELLNQGSISAKETDYMNLKQLVLDWICAEDGTLTPPLSRRRKEDRGFNHDVTGRLLCPVGLDWENDAVKKSLQSTQGNLIGDPWPICLYKDYTFDPSDPWKGLLQSQILKQAYRCIFVMNGCTCQEHSVTISSIAYAAAQLQFALSPAPDFAAIRRGEEKYEGLYNSLMTFLEDPGNEGKTAELLAFWDHAFKGMYAKAAHRGEIQSRNGRRSKPRGRKPERTLIGEYIRWKRLRTEGASE